MPLWIKAKEVILLSSSINDKAQILNNILDFGVEDNVMGIRFILNQMDD